MLDIRWSPYLPHISTDLLWLADLLVGPFPQWTYSIVISYAPYRTLLAFASSSYLNHLNTMYIYLAYHHHPSLHNLYCLCAHHQCARMYASSIMHASINIITHHVTCHTRSYLSMMKCAASAAAYIIVSVN